MPINKRQFLTLFSQQALDARTSLFLGAGASRDAGNPGWNGLFRQFATTLNVTIDETTDYYKLAQYYTNDYGPAALRRVIHEQLNNNNHNSQLLDELVDIGFSNVWTTNFDNAMELNYQDKGILTNKVFRDSDFSNIDINKRINVFKMNGDITNTEGIVATQSDYEKYADSHKIMLMFFKRELISSTFLFIGYSFTDHLVLECLSEITRYLSDTNPYHYTIMKREPENQYFEYFIEDLERRYHIRVLLVDNYEEIPCILAELNEKIRSKRVFISGAYHSLTEQIEAFSHSFSRNLTTALLEHDYRIVNGIGLHFGTHLIGYANEFLAKKGTKDIEKYLIIKPFVGNNEDAAENKKRSREKVIKQCGSAIFVFGDVDHNALNATSGVMEEFEIACEQHKAVIPVSYPGMVSSEIWNTVKSNITRFPYLEESIDKLNSDQATPMLAKQIIHILDSVHNDK